MLINMIKRRKNHSFIFMIIEWCLSSLHPRMLCAKLVEIGAVILEKQMKNVKCLRTKGDLKKSLELSAQVS